MLWGSPGTRVLALTGKAAARLPWELTGPLCEGPKAALPPHCPSRLQHTALSLQGPLHLAWNVPPWLPLLSAYDPYQAPVWVPNMVILKAHSLRISCILYHFLFVFSLPPKDLPAIRETSVRSLGWEDPLEKGKATHSSILAWKFQGLYSPWGHKESDTTEPLTL